MLKLPRKKVALIALSNEQRSSSGLIILPQGSEGRIDNGIVKYMGPECEYVSIGDHCIFSGWSGTQLDMDGEPTLIIIDEDYLTAVVNDTKEVLVKDLYVRLEDGTLWNPTVEAALDLIGVYAQQNMIETSKRKPYNAEKDDWKGSAIK